jgi:hypothetical protein
MNSHSEPESPLPPDELFVDSALLEKARLDEEKNDDALIRSILLKTVERPFRNETLHLSPAADRKSWFITVASAAAAVALLLSVLTNLSVRDTRQEEEVVFLVQYADDSATTPAVDKNSKAAVKSTRPVEETVEIGTPDFVASPSIVALDLDWELTTIFGQSVRDFAPRTMRRATFRIEADNAIEQAREKIYSGNVIVHYEGFRVEAEQLRVAKASHSGVSQDSNTVTGSNVILRQDHPERLVKAEKFEFRPLSGSLVLSRVREFSGENETGLEVNEESQIVLTADSISLDSEL